MRPPSAMRILFVLRETIAFAVRLLRARFRRAGPAERGLLTRVYLETLAGPWLKLGQILAMRTDLFDAEFCRELGKLQDQATGFDPALARQSVESQLGVPLDRVFDVFVDAPVAAASFAQVHKARLAVQKTWVAVKVQRPWAEEHFRGDMRWLSVILRLLDLLHIGPNFHWTEMLAELRAMMLEELDYRYEATALRDMRRVLKTHGIYVPKVFLEYSGGRVLVMEFIEGVAVSEFVRVRNADPARVDAWLEENGIDRCVVAQWLLDSLLRQTFEDFVVHGDLHPGNIILLRESRMAFIDFGTISLQDREFIGRYERYIRALMSRNFEEAADLMMMIFGPLPRTDLHALKQQMVAAMRRWQQTVSLPNTPFHARSLSSSSNEIGRVALRYRIESNWGMLRLGRAFNSLDLSIGALYPEAQYPKMMLSFFRRAQPRERARNLRRILSLPMQVVEVATLALPRFREAQLRLRDTAGRLDELAGSALQAVRGAVLVTFVYLLAAAVHQISPGVLTRRLAGEPALLHALEAMPPLGTGGWIALLSISVVILLRVHGLTVRHQRQVVRFRDQCF